MRYKHWNTEATKEKEITEEAPTHSCRARAGPAELAGRHATRSEAAAGPLLGADLPPPLNAKPALSHLPNTLCVLPLFFVPFVFQLFR
jgi:hypothetical protein